MIANPSLKWYQRSSLPTLSNLRSSCLTILNCILGKSSQKVRFFLQEYLLDNPRLNGPINYLRSCKNFGRKKYVLHHDQITHEMEGHLYKLYLLTHNLIHLPPAESAQIHKHKIFLIMIGLLLQFMRSCH